MNPPSTPTRDDGTIALTPIRSRNSDNDSVASKNQKNPFATPSHNSRAGSVSVLQLGEKRWFHSRRVKKGMAEKPWMDKKDPKEKWVTIIPLIGLFLGLAIAGLLVWDGLRSVVNHNYCLVLDEDWSKGFNDKIWIKEAEVGGFGNGQFEETTSGNENSFIKDGMLYIMPTLQDQKLIDTNASMINLLDLNACASSRWFDCVAMTNHDNGTIVPPVKSARVSTKRGAKIKYGRIEVTALLPQGDWLWPAIWMLPTSNEYGPWPRSGEIDIAESRGNKHKYKQGGNNIISSTLHWGPNPSNDGWWRNNVKQKALHTTYSDRFHTFGLEWSEKYIFTYVNSRLLQVMYTNFDEAFWKRGQFPLSDSNGTKLDDPWSATGRLDTPFDQDFYLILSLGIGGTNGWFQDGEDGKPWVDSSPNAKLDFWKARDKWLPTWQEKGHMIVKSVKMWQQEGYNGC